MASSPRLPLRRNEDVRPDSPVVDPEPAPGPAEPRHHLVGDEQDAVAAADLGDQRPVVVGRDDGRERGPDDRLGDERRDRARLRGLDRPLELRRQLGGVAEGVTLRFAGAVRVGGGEVAEPSEPRLVGASKRAPPRQVQGAQGVAVIAPPAGENDPAVGLAPGEVVRADELQGRLDRLRPAANRVDRRAVEREDLPDLAGVGLDGLGREGRAVGVRQAARLAGKDVGDRPAAVSDVHDDGAARSVEVLTTVRVDDRRTATLDRDRRRGVERAAEHATRSTGRRR
jgi:hypothetical protein